ncbi:MAG: GNAT family N-acetyltransferase [Candidatus Limnocylindrales bacterium]
MTASPRLISDRLEPRPLPSAAAGALPGDRALAARLLDATLSPAWPLADLLDVLPMQAAADAAAEPFGVWVMIDREGREVIGDIGFMGPPDPDGSVEVGYSVVPGHRRRGYATEAARAVVAWALEQPDVKRVIAHCKAGNEPSIRTLERTGFQRTGEADGLLAWRIEPAGRDWTR